MISGIYQIRNTLNNKVYVGSTKNFEKRKGEHFRDLKKNNHKNVKLQRSFNKYGEDKFIFEILCLYPYDKTIVAEEQKWIDNLNSKKNGFNIADAAFGDILTNHPDKENIKKRISEGLLRKNALLSPEERKEKWAQCGDKNGMFGGTHSQEARDKIAKAQKDIRILTGHGATFGIKKSEVHRQKISEIAKGRTGEKNSFYGRKHSEKTKAILSEKQKGIIPTNAKRISVDGIEYAHRRDASVATGIKQETLWYRANSNNFPNIKWI
jgi:group I intron endonuclease